MTRLADIGLTEMTWEYPEEENHPFHLRAADATVGWMEFPEGPSRRSSGELGARWSFEHSSGSHPHVTVYRGASNDIAAEYAPDLRGGIVTFPSGTQFCWRRGCIWGTRWCFKGRNREASVCLSQETGPLIHGGKVTVCAEAAKLEETPVLLLLAWYLRVLQFQVQAERITTVG